MHRIAIINGPNLNTLGKREPEIYGYTRFEDYLLRLKDHFSQVELTYFQSNIEGEIISEIQKRGFDPNYLGIVINAGAYSHTSIAIADAIVSIDLPVIAVHISNIYARETERRTDLLLAHSRGNIAGFGLYGYKMAIAAILSNFDSF